MTATASLWRCWCLVFGFLVLWGNNSAIQAQRIVLRGDETPRKLTDQQSFVADNGIAHLVVGVSDLDETLKLWVDTFGFELIVRQKGADAGLAKMWDMKPERIVDQALVGTPGIRTGRLHFVQFKDPLPPVRQDSVPTDLLPKNIDVVTKDLPVKYDALLKAGRQFRSELKRYQIADHPGDPLNVIEVQMPSHDETNVMIIEILGINYPFGSKGYAGMTNFVPIVENGELEEKFYAEVLGFPLLSTHELKGEALEKMIGLPKGTILDVRILGVEENYFGRIEMIDYRGVESRNRYDRAVPGALGVTHAVFFSNAIAEIKRRAQQHKVKMIDHGSVKTVFGTLPAISVFTPAGMRLDIFGRNEVTTELTR